MRAERHSWEGWSAANALRRTERRGPAGESSKTGSIGEAGEVGEAGTTCCAAGTGAGGSSLPTFLEPIRFSAVLDKHLT